MDISWDNLTTAPQSGEIFGPWSTAFLVVCSVVMLVGFALFARPEMVSSRRLLRITSARRWGTILMWIASLGFFFFIVRWLQINPFTFGTPIWLLLIFIATVVALLLLAVQMRAESMVLSHERAQRQDAIARGIHNRRPPRRSASRKR